MRFHDHDVCNVAYDRKGGSKNTGALPKFQCAFAKLTTCDESGASFESLRRSAGILTAILTDNFNPGGRNKYRKKSRNVKIDLNR